ncbi:MAG: GDSL family lipase [Selenomonas sp.]|uniref:SGNH/GDSL hydrolase family protein n=1 Tax=Selenomonas sp. TaxID=2053611 RepID=UPI0025D16114|nr:GDSL-type esterase/lipase family protein [Selenomonas sp.]MCR5758194.1 GDSL family lipase [Selenomonas sp.]
MKKFLLFTLVILSFTILSAFVAEKTDVMGLHSMAISASFNEENGHLTLTWDPLPYPCFYKVETYSSTTGLVEGEPDSKFWTSNITMNASLELPSSAIPMNYRVTAYGMFGLLAGPSRPIQNPIHNQEPLSPSTISHYGEDNPASLMPFLIWHSVPNAVCYEVELLAGKPAQERGISPDKNNHLESTQLIFTNGWQADLKKYANRKFIYWRVRALDIHHQPIGEFSPAEELHIDANLPQPDHPLLNEFDQMPNFEMPLYPVYQWIPLNDVERYEVELMIHPPIRENDNAPTADAAWRKVVNSATACYDEYPRPYAGDYYWRVRGIDKDGNPVGVWSSTAHFVVQQQPERVPVAVLGDSITHGGGAVSNSPAALEYSYTTYLNFPCLNLGRSGDTSTMTLQRFEQDVLPYKPLNLMILTGTNSLRASNLKPEIIIRDLAELKEKCEANDIRPIFLTLMPINPANIQFAFHTTTDKHWETKLQQVNAWIRSQPYYIDLEPYFYDSSHRVMDTGFSIDGLHPDVRGKMLMGEIINQHRDVFRQ